MFASKLSRSAFARTARNFGHHAKESTKPAEKINFFKLMHADNSKTLTKYFHNSGIALAVLIPLAFAPNVVVSYAANVAMAPIIGFHSLVGMNGVVSDYIPKQWRGYARFGVMGASAVIVLGAFNLIFQGHRLSDLIGDLWRKPKKDEE